MPGGEGQPPQVHIIVVTGLSGSGKSTAIRALEDLGYFCVDNLPVALLPRFVELALQSSEPVTDVALVMDIREAGFVEQAAAVFEAVRSVGHELHVLYLHADVDVLVRRYSETRRRHPLSPRGSAREGIDKEIEQMAPIRHLADQTIDTTVLTVHDLKRRVQGLYGAATEERPALSVNVLSFGFKHGLPAEADLVFDVRFLTNPYFDQTLRPLTGLSEEVASFVLVQQPAQTFLGHVYSLLDFLLPHYEGEGKSYVTVAIGCTGGQHRSVAIAEEITRRITPLPFNVSVRHRDARNPDGTPVRDEPEK